jgi:hypothetical protein
MRQSARIAARPDQQGLNRERLSWPPREFDVIDDSTIRAITVDQREIEQLADQLDRAVGVHPFPPEVRK